MVIGDMPPPLPVLAPTRAVRPILHAVENIHQTHNCLPFERALQRLIIPLIGKQRHNTGQIYHVVKLVVRFKPKGDWTKD